MKYKNGQKVTVQEFQAKNKKLGDVLPNGQAWCYHCDNIAHECECEWEYTSGMKAGYEWYNVTKAEADEFVTIQMSIRANRREK